MRQQIRAAVTDYIEGYDIRFISKKGRGEEKRLQGRIKSLRIF
jgi:hypothetical protein